MTEWVSRKQNAHDHDLNLDVFYAKTEYKFLLWPFTILVHIWTKMYTVHCTVDMIWDIEGNDEYILPYYCYVNTKSRIVLFWCPMVRDLKLIFLNCLSSLSRVWGIYIFCRILVNCISRKVKMSRNNIIWVWCSTDGRWDDYVDVFCS